VLEQAFSGIHIACVDYHELLVAGLGLTHAFYFSLGAKAIRPIVTVENASAGQPTNKEPATPKTVTIRIVNALLSLSIISLCYLEGHKFLRLVTDL
jgi:hypothetical protein